MRILAMTLAAAIAVPAPAAGQALRLDAASGHVVTVMVNGQPLRLRTDPGANGDVTLNPDAAARARLRPSPIRVTGLIGPVRVRGRVAQSAFTIDGRKAKAAFTWYDRAVVSGADGLISPGALPYDTVELTLGPARSGEHTHSIAIAFSRDTGIGHRLMIGAQPVLVRFALKAPRTIATAAAGAVLAQGRGGEWRGATQAWPINLGVTRPVRTLDLSRPIGVGAFALRTLLVRVADFRGSHAIPDGASEDASEIVVTAPGRRRQKAYYELVIGRDLTAACSLVRYRRAAARIEWSCAPSR